MAVLLVVLFHCKAGIPGGYVGVDVFFVISGFLITTQLVRELRDTGRISFRGFYARRARRILPAATLTTVVTIVVAGMLLPPLAAIRVLGDARAAAVFSANIHFAARDADYFNADLAPSPLQHYWSLSVEEQFYLVWPVLLVLSSLVWLRIRRRPSSARDGARERAASIAARPRIRLVIVILASVAGLSFASSVLGTSHSPTLAYYSLGTRAWELAAGALVALSLPVAARLETRIAGVLTWTGVAGIAAAAMFFDRSTPYPGDAALLPVAGAVAIIFAGSAARKRWGAEALLSTAPFQRLGAWSYSWYLWHWPVLILAPYLLGHSLSTLEALIMALMSLVIAILSFVLVERPIRRSQTFVRHPSLGLIGGAALIATSLVAVALARPVFATLPAGPPVAPPVLVSRGTTPLSTQLAADLRFGVKTVKVPSNLDPSVTVAAEDKPLIDKNGCLLVDAAVKRKPCVYGDKTSHTSVVLFGDSHAAAWFPAVDKISRQDHWRLVVEAKSGCPAAAVNVVRYGRLFTNCAVWRHSAERQIAALHPALVIVAYSQYLHGDRPLAGVPTGYGSTWLNGTQATFSFLHHAATRAVFITDVPMLTQVAPDCVSGHMSNVRPCTVARTTGIRYPQVTREERELAARNHIQSINSTPWFCTPVRCPVIVDNILMYRDAQHMTPQWSRFLVPILADALKPIARPSKSPPVARAPRGAHAASR